MDALLKLGSRLNGKTVTLIIALVVVGVAFAILTSLSSEQHEELCGSCRTICRSQCS